MYIDVFYYNNILSSHFLSFTRCKVLYYHTSERKPRVS